MRILVALAVLAGSAHADGLHRTVAPMTRADGSVCDLLRSEIKDTCKPIAQLGNATVYQSGSKQAGIRRTVLAIETDAGVLVGPAVDVLLDDAAKTAPQLQAITIDGHPGFALDVTAKQRESLVGCARGDAGLWKCAMIDADGNAAAKSLLSLR